MPDSVIYFIDNETEKALANVSGNNVNIHNPNINLPNSLGKAVASLGIGGAIATGISTAGTFMKSSTPLGVKLGATAAGGAIGGALFVSTNYMNTIAQKQAESKSGNKSYCDPNSFSAKSMSENYNSDTDYLDAVIGLLDTNLLLHFSILYLLICLPVLYITTNISTDKLNINFIKNTFGVNIHNLIVKLLKYVSKTNKI